MEKAKEIKKINLKIVKIKELSFSCKELPDDLKTKLTETNVVFGIGLRLVPNPPLKEFGIALLIKYEYQEGNINEELCQYEIECVFKIMEFDQAIKLNKTKINIEDSILSNLLSITIGTIRGMLALKTAGTVLNAYPLPLLNPMDIIQKLKVQSK